MAKELQTRDQLQRMLLDAAKATGKCGDLIGVAITGPHDVRAGDANWRFTVQQHGSKLVSDECKGMVEMEFGLIAAKYDLKA